MERSTSATPEALGDFQIIGLLGEGGSGVVYLARWGHRQVALKVLRPELLPSKSLRARFLGEAKILAAIEHPSVVKVLGYGELPDGRPYLAMEKLDGESLAARIARGPLPPAEALALFAQLADAVAVLHERGLVHRDLKPENAYVVAEKYAVLLDFGIAKGRDVGAGESTVTQEGVVRGTPAYMAPERFFGAAASEKSDLYELAVVLYAMLVGRLPWRTHDDPSARLNPPRPSELGAPVGDALERELMRALSTRAEGRHEGVRAFAAAVKQSGIPDNPDAPRRTVDLPRSSGGPTPVATISQTGKQPATRRWGRWAALAVLLAAAGITAAVALSRRGGTPAAAAVASAPATPPAPPPPAGSDLARILALHPRDTGLLVGLRLDKLRDAPAVRATVAAHRGGPTGKAIGMLGMMCGMDPLERLRWITLGASSQADPVGDVAASGVWTRADVEKCLRTMELVPLREGRVSTIKAGLRAFALGFADEQTAFFSARPAADRAWVEARLDGQDAAASGALAELATHVDPEAALWAVAVKGPWLGRDEIGGVPAPSAAWANLVVGSTAELKMTWRYDSPVLAAAAAAKARAELDTLRKEQPLLSVWLTRTEVKEDGADLQVDLFLDEKSTRITADSLVKSIDDMLEAAGIQ